MANARVPHAVQDAALRCPKIVINMTDSYSNLGRVVSNLGREILKRKREAAKAERAAMRAERAKRLKLEQEKKEKSAKAADAAQCKFDFIRDQE